jgi:hypothetical protein
MLPKKKIKCNVCDTLKPFEVFYNIKTKALSSTCNECRAINQARRIKPKTKVDTVKYRNDLCKRYNISSEQYNFMLELQNGTCSICGKTDIRNGQSIHLSIDHCHKTGKIRALLCGRCNMVLGLVNDDVSVLNNMIKYCKHHNAKK